MKKIVYTYIAILLAVLMVSCQKEYVKPTPIIPVPEGKEYVEFFASKESAKSGTKAYFGYCQESTETVNDSAAIWWNGDDAIAVYDNASEIPATFLIKPSGIDQSAENTRSAILYGNVNEGWEMLYAVTPYESVNSCTFADAKARVTLNSNQTISADNPVSEGKEGAVNVDRSAMIAMAKVKKGTGGAPECTDFYTACAYIKFKFDSLKSRNGDVTDSIKKITVTSLDGFAMAGTYDLTLGDSKLTIGKIDTSSTITLNCNASGVKFKKGKSYIIPVIPGNFTGGFRFNFFVQEKNGSETEYYCPYPVAVDLKSNNGIYLGDLTKTTRCKMVSSERAFSVTATTITSASITFTVHEALDEIGSGSFSSMEVTSGTWTKAGGDKRYYEAALYTDETCTGLAVKKEKYTRSRGEDLVITYDKLTPSTQYWCKVQNYYNGKTATATATTTATAN